MATIVWLMIYLTAAQDVYNPIKVTFFFLGTLLKLHFTWEKV
jgi:hypothetical protein